MAETEQINSILAADFGSVNTRLVLIDLVDGAYRLVARDVVRTTSDDQLRDISVGLYRAMQRMSERTGRLLTKQDGNAIRTPEDADGRGVDAFLATASTGRPLRVMLVGLTPEVSITTGLQVLSGTYVEVVDTLSLADIRTEEEQINAILSHKPDLIFIVGGTDAGAEDSIMKLVKVVSDAARMAVVEPVVLYAGNRAVQDQVSETLTDTSLFVADNVRPSLWDEQPGSAQQQLAAVFDGFKINQGRGFDVIGEITSQMILPTAQSYTNIVRYLGETVEKGSVGVLAVDVGSATTTVAASIHKQPYVNIRPDLGVGHSAAGITQVTTQGNIRRWLTWDATDAEIADYVYNKTLRPATVPQTQRELELEYALARETIRVVVEQARSQWGVEHSGGTLPPFQPIIGAGAVLANAPHMGVAALILLDALQPVGVTELWLDAAGLIPAMGALAYLNPPAVVQMLDAGDLEVIGTAICAEGKVRIGRGGMKVTIKLEDGQVEKRRVTGGTIWTYPLPPGQTAQVQIGLSRTLRVNGKSRLKLKVKGGTAGLIFDARGRPLPLPRQAEARAKLYPRWVAGTKGHIRLRIDELDESEVDKDELAQAEIATASDAFEVAPEEKPLPKRRRGLFGRRRKGDDEEELDSLADSIEASMSDESVAEQEEEVEEQPRRRFGLRRRRVQEEEPATAEDVPEAELDEMDEMMDDLRASTDEQKRRGFLRRQR